RSRKSAPCGLLRVPRRDYPAGRQLARHPVDSLAVGSRLRAVSAFAKIPRGRNAKEGSRPGKAGEWRRQVDNRGGERNLTRPALIRLGALCVVGVGLLVAGGTASATTGTHIIASSGTIVVPNAPAPVATPFSSLEIRPGDDGDPLPAGAHVPNPGL